MLPTNSQPLGFVVAASIWISGCANENYAKLYHTENVAPSLSWDEIQTLDYMGPTLIDDGVNFCVYSERAERIELLLFDDPESTRPTWQIPLVQNGTVWNIYVEGIGKGQHYGYVAWGPNWTYDEEWSPGTIDGFLTDVDSHGNRFNPNKLLFDPYAKALHRDHDWSLGSTASGPARSESTYAAAAKSVVIATKDTYTWSDNETAWRAARQSGDHEGHDWTDLVIYEVQPKGLTMNPASSVEHPGTFAGIGEMAAYLQDLGITAIELMPVHEKPLDGGYWGYNSLSFFAPELTFSATYKATGEPDKIIDEFREMVDTLHQHDIEVLLDVVYNHTGEGGLWRERLYFESYDDAYEVNFDPKEVAGLYSYRGLDNNAYYALTDDGQYYWNNTGVGNETRSNHTPMNRLIMDSLRFCVEELHIDGFRFDLAGILGEPDLDYNSYVDPSQTILQQIIDDPTLQQYNTRIIAEPWTAAGTGPGIGGFPDISEGEGHGWAEWNPYFRDWWRSFLNDSSFVLNSTEGVDGGAVMTASEEVYGWNGRPPTASVNFITAHDGFTLYDLFSYDERQNGCGLLNPVCCDEPMSVWCDDESGEENNRSLNWGDEPTKRQLMRNMFVAMLTSHGTPMLLGGDEWMRTQFGNNNAYSDSADNAWNWFRWGEWQSVGERQRYRMHDFVRGMIRLRSEYSAALSPSTYNGGMPYSWKNSENNELEDEEWSTNRHVAIHYYDDGNWSDESELLILINMESDAVTFSLPEGRDWARLVDTQTYFDTPGQADEAGEGGYFEDNPNVDPFYSANITLEEPESISEGQYSVPSNSIVILADQS